jgi:hypothetical protein
MVRQTKKPLIRQAPSRKSGGSLGQRRCLVDPSLDRLGAERRHLSNSSLQASCQFLSGTIPEIIQSVNSAPENRAFTDALKIAAGLACG